MDKHASAALMLEGFLRDVLDLNVRITGISKKTHGATTSYPVLLLPEAAASSHHRRWTGPSYSVQLGDSGDPQARTRPDHPGGRAARPEQLIASLRPPEGRKWFWPRLQMSPL